MKNILLILALIISTYTQCQELVWQSYNEEILYSTINEPSRGISFYSDGSIIREGIEYDHLKKYGISGIRKLVDDIKRVQKNKEPISTDLYTIEKGFFGSAKLKLTSVPRKYNFTKSAIKSFEKYLKKFE